MDVTNIMEELKHDFNLKKNHILILNTLSEKDLIADEICKRTNIPKGRIYDSLNELISIKLIKKIGKAPATYTLGDFRKNILDFLKIRFDQAVDKQLKLISLLEKEETLEDIKLINSREQYEFMKIDMLSKRNEFKIIHRHMSLPWFIFPREDNKFLEIRDQINKRRAALTSVNKDISLMLFKAHLEVYGSGRKIEHIMTKDALDAYMKMIKEEYGKGELKKWALKVKKDLRKNKNVKVWVVENFYSIFNTHITEKEVTLVLIHSNLLTGARIYSEKIVGLYTRSFDEIRRMSKPIQKYLN